MNYIVNSIEWDIDNDDVDLPEELTVNVPDEISEQNIIEYIGNKITEITDFCHLGFSITPEV